RDHHRERSCEEAVIVTAEFAKIQPTSGNSEFLRIQLLEQLIASPAAFAIAAAPAIASTASIETAAIKSSAAKEPAAIESAPIAATVAAAISHALHFLHHLPVASHGPSHPLFRRILVVAAARSLSCRRGRASALDRCRARFHVAQK